MNMLGVEPEGDGKDQLLLLVAKLIIYQHMQDLGINLPFSSSSFSSTFSSCFPV